MDPFKNQDQCPVATSNATNNQSNPINTFTGAKHETDTDYRGSGPFPLVFTRYYSNGLNRNHAALDPVFSKSALGRFWGHSYARKIEYFNNGTLSAVTAYRPEGNRFYFNEEVANGVSTWRAIDADVPDTLSKTTDAAGNPVWRYGNKAGETEIYDFGTGRLIAIVNQSGRTQTLSYNANGQLDSVADEFGHRLEFGYNESGIAKDLLSFVQAVSTAHPGQAERYEYEYVNSATSGTMIMLAKVTYPDDTPATNSDNPRKEYKYNETLASDPLGVGYFFNRYDVPYTTNPSWAARHMTGIIDENGARFATFKYRDYPFSGGYYYMLAKQSGHGTPTNGVYADQVTFADYYASFSSLDALGTTRRYTRNVQFGAAKQSAVDVPGCAQCGGSPKATTFDPATGFVSSNTDFNGNVTKYSFNARGLEECRVEGFTADAAKAAQMRKTTTQWNTDLRLPTEVIVWKYASGVFAAGDPCNAATVAWARVRTTSNVYTSGRLTSKTETDNLSAPNASRTTTYSYNAQGLLDTVDGPRTDVPDTTAYQYDGQGNVSRIISGVQGTAALTTAINAYDLSGRPLRITDPNGVVTTLAYYPRGWLKTRTVDGLTTTYAYDNVGQMTKVTLPDGSFTAFAYDDAHRLYRVADSLGNSILYTLDPKGNRIAEKNSDPSGTLKRQLTRTYSALNRLQQVTNGAGGSTQYTYDANHNLLRTIDARDPNPSAPTIYTENTYDALNRLASVRDALGGMTYLTRDAFDNVTSITDPKNQATSYIVNGFGERVQHGSPDTGTTTYAYDAAGNRVSETDARGVTVLYSYDALNRLTKIDYPDPQTDVLLTYDDNDAGQNGKGRLTQISDESGAVAYRYDLQGNVVQKIVSFSGGPALQTINFSYDAAGRPSGVTYPSGRSVTYARDGGGRIAGVTETKFGIAKPLISGAGYAPFGPLVGFKFGASSSALTYTKSLDQDYRIAGLAETGVASLSYGYLPAGASDNIAAITDALNPAFNQSFEYDNLDRLRMGSGSYGTKTYSYDAVGNRLSENSAAPPNLYSAGTNRLLQVTGGPGYTYDAAGNARTRTEGGATFTLAYGMDNRLLDVQNGASLVATYLHAASGARSAKTAAAESGNQTTFYLTGLQGELLGEANAEGQYTREYAYLDDLLVAVMTPELDPNTDTDGDGMSNGFEVRYDLNPRNSADASADSDVDGLTNLQEYQKGTDPTNPDTDGDGMRDNVDPFPTVSTAALLLPILQQLQN